jgi:hypothetical protein
MVEAFPSLMSIVTFPVRGEHPRFFIKFRSFLLKSSVLEYLFRDDAERAVRELDGKELRGRPVRVSLDESVRVLHLFSLSLS